MHVRAATAHDLTAIYRMGYDVWGDGAAEDAYLRDCANSGKYKLGVWHVLADADGAVVSSLICYKDAFGLESGCIGIGSVATAPEHRRQGYAARLLAAVVEQLLRDGSDCLFLYADAAPELYEKIGFRALPDSLQRYQPSICMALSKTPPVAAPSYF